MAGRDLAQQPVLVQRLLPLGQQTVVRRTHAQAVPAGAAEQGLQRQQTQPREGLVDAQSARPLEVLGLLGDGGGIQPAQHQRGRQRMAVGQGAGRAELVGRGPEQGLAKVQLVARRQRPGLAVAGLEIGLQAGAHAQTQAHVLRQHQAQAGQHAAVTGPGGLQLLAAIEGIRGVLDHGPRVVAADEQVGIAFDIGQLELGRETHIQLDLLVAAVEQLQRQPAFGDLAALLEGPVAKPAVDPPRQPVGGLAGVLAGGFHGLDRRLGQQLGLGWPARLGSWRRSGRRCGLGAGQAGQQQAGCRRQHAGWVPARPAGQGERVHGCQSALMGSLRAARRARE